MDFRVTHFALAALLLTPPPAAAAPQTHVVVIARMKFAAAPLNVRAGDRITWINQDLFRHTATATDGSFNVDLLPGAKATVVVRKAGAISVICRYHPGMRTRLKVAG
jgi:plastocyanin